MFPFQIVWNNLMITTNMLRHGVMSLTSTVFLLLLKCILTQESPTTGESKCEYTDTEKHVNMASQFIEASLRKLTNDMKELCRMSSWNPPLFSADCENRNRREQSVARETAKPVDCSDIYQSGNHFDGAYEIWPQGGSSTGPLRVYCDMDTDGGGWTVIQRRGEFGNPQDYFFRSWNDYKAGFGDVVKEFWLGNENIYMLTNQRYYQLRVDLMSWEGDTAYITYNQFRIEGESDKYKLHIGSVINGSAGDSLSYHNGMQFSTKDRDNDEDSRNCAEYRKGAWWYKNCHHSNLNGLHLPGTNTSGKGIGWFHWRNSWMSLKASAMKIRPANFHEKGTS